MLRMINRQQDVKTDLANLRKCKLMTNADPKLTAVTLNLNEKREHDNSIVT